MFIADFHIHSRFSRATSPQMTVPVLAEHAAWKGVDLLATGDFTHPIWLKELEAVLRSAGKGLFRYKETQFILQAEVNVLFYREGKAKNVHMILFVPSFKEARAVNKKMSQWGDLSADGRPIVSVEIKEFMKEMIAVCPDMMFVPAHIWTPYFSVFGARARFTSLEECFGEYTDKLTALETGLSSDPAMNWRVSALDRFSLISNSDSHSPMKIGREANVFTRALDYFELKETLEKKKNKNFKETIEFFPHEGKYHYDGHRKCGVCLHPAETAEHNGLCPVCGKKLTVGVVNQVDTLADRAEGVMPEGAVPFRTMIPLIEIIAACKGRGVATKGVAAEYHQLINQFKTEIDILFDVSVDKVSSCAGDRIAEGIMRAREGNVTIHPGYDGEYGTIQIFGEDEEKISAKQKDLF